MAPDLAVHHPRRGAHVDPGIGLGDRDLGIALERGVVVDLTRRRQQPAVPVVGVLVEAQVGHQHQRVADVVTKLAHGHLDDPVRIRCPGSGGVLVFGYAEQDHGRHAERRELGHLLAEGLPAVLHDAGQRWDRDRFRDALADEERGDEIIDGESGLGDESTDGRSPAQPPRTLLGEGHGR